MAELGHTVVGIDVDEEKVAALSAAKAPFYEPGLDDLLASGPLRPGGSASPPSFAAAADADVHFICVGTPQRAGEFAADLTYVEAAADLLAPYLRRPTLVVGKSTVPVGTAARIAARLTAAAPAGAEVELAWNPEFLREGHAIEDTVRPDRLVYGVDGSDAATDLLDEVYAAPIAAGTPRLVTDLATAELVKAAANSFLATKISFINAMSEVCEAAGADVVAAGRRDRLRRPDRAQVPRRRAGFRWRLPAQGHPRVHGPGRRARRRPGPDLPARGRRDQPAPPLPDGRPGPRPVRGVVPGPPDRRAGRGVQAGQRRHPRLARAQRRRADPAAGRPRHGARPAGPGQRSQGLAPARPTPTRSTKLVRGQLSCCT